VIANTGKKTEAAEARKGHVAVDLGPGSLGVRGTF
jgi:hypothetical protein